MHTADLILLLIGFVCFFLATIGAPAIDKPRVNLVALGLACWILVPLTAELQHT